MGTLPSFYKRRRWTGKGYHAYPIPDSDKRDLPNLDQWLQFDAVVSEAKAGNFARIPHLAEWLVTSDDWVLQGEYSQLLGDAGSSSMLSQILRQLPVGQDIILEFVYAQLLECWGHLSVIPALIDMYERYSFSEDAMYVAQSLSRLVESVPGELAAFPANGSVGEVRSYCEMASRQYRELCDRLGTEDAIVFRGEIVGVERIGQRILDDLSMRKTLHEEMRHKLEAYTGADCSGFYENEALRPLTVAAITEDVLNRSDVAQLQEGVRYFFGHRLS